ncbi:MAG: hypothetical protein ACRC1U_09150 [Vibrionaceae bacterium]
MTDFLIEIGRQQKSLSQGVEIELNECEEEQMVAIAVMLGDIIEIGATTLSKKKGFASAFCCCTQRAKSYPVYQFAGGAAFNPLKFTLDSRFAEPADTSVPPRIHHIQGKVHKGMEAVLWGGYCYEHPCRGDLLGDYEDLRRGIYARYSGGAYRSSRL